MRTRKGKPKTVFKTILNMALAMSIVLSSVAVPNVVRPITAHAKTYNTLGGGTGSNYYYFSYIYDPAGDGIALHIHTNSNNVVAMNYQNDFTCSRSFNQKLEMENPKCTHTLEAAVGDMNAATGKNVDVNKVLDELRQDGYYIEDGVHNTPGIWRIKDGNGFRYLTYLDGENCPPLDGTHLVETKHATCTESGYDLWSDGSHRNLTPALGHIWPKEWEDVGTHHEKRCQREQYGCNHSLLDSEPHRYEKTNGYDYIDDKNGATHHRVCVDCGHIETDNHHFTKWEDDDNRPGWQIRHCEGCGYRTWRDVEPPKVMIYASKSGKWTAGDVKITVQAWDQGSGIKLIRLYRTNKYTNEVQQVKSGVFKGETDWQSITFTEKEEGEWTYSANALDMWHNLGEGVFVKNGNEKKSLLETYNNADKTKKNTDDVKLDHSDPTQDVKLNGKNAKSTVKTGTHEVYHPGEEATITERKTVPKVPVYENVVDKIKGKAVEEKYNTITYNLDGGGFYADAPTEYINGKETSVPNPQKAGYKFGGWTMWIQVRGMEHCI
jgi:hypothetical protein